MTDHLKQTVAAKDVMIVAAKEIADECVATKIKAANDIYAKMAANYAGMAEEMRKLAGCIIQNNSLAKSARAALEDAERRLGTYELAAKRADIGQMSAIVMSACHPDEGVCDIDSDEVFMAFMGKITKQNVDIFGRMKACAQANDKIGVSIKQWQSKIDSMKERMAFEGSSENERKVCAVKVKKFEIAVEEMKRRGEIVTTLYYSLKRVADAKTREVDAVFTPIFKGVK